VETIVVGVDGSECATAALEFAAEEAALRSARLRIVCVWDMPAIAYGGGYTPPLDEQTFQAFRTSAERIADEAAQTAKRLQPTVDCELQVVEGQPAAVLLEQAADATLVVVGNRGRGGFTSLLLGSVSHQVVHHASCPVVVVHAVSSAEGQRETAGR
jgi:nucleotide-binding universal stress UspA family protein